MKQDSLPYVLFQIEGHLYAIDSGRVREILALPKITGVPNAPPEIRGVMNLRGKVIQLIDLRVKLGLSPLQEELKALSQLLSEREQEHRDWLAELEDCIREKRPFTKQRDPHKCKFGQWYDTYKTEDRLLGMTLPSMDKPHRVIHATADEALARMESGDTEGALRLINARRNGELAVLIKLFTESRRILAEEHRELAVVLERGTEQLAFSADMVEEVEPIPEDRIEAMPVTQAGLSDGSCFQVGRRLETDQTVLLLNDDLLFSSGCLMEAEQRS